MDQVNIYRSFSRVGRLLLVIVLTVAVLPLGGSRATAAAGDDADEMFFYRDDDGLFRYYDVRPDGTLGSRLSGGSGYTPGWSSITAVDLDGPSPSHLVSRFTTYHSCCQPRVHNIQTMARQMNGAIVMPWETLDLNAYLGPRTRAKGYVPAPILLNGEGYCCDHPLNIGGGTSQFGTTIYNAIFWGGYDEIAHRPHSRYINRYPLGIEATLADPTPNVVFLNDTWTPITIKTSYTSTSITVEFWGNNGGRTVVGSHRNGRTTITVTNRGDSTARHVTAKVTGSATYSGGGWVTVTRTISGPGGTTSETWNHRYLGS